VTESVRNLSFYFFDIDDNVLHLPAKLYVRNAETRCERAISSEGT